MNQIDCNFVVLESYNPCPSPDNRNGVCVPLRSCQTLFTLLQKVPLTQEERIYLGRSQCGYYAGTPWASLSNKTLRLWILT